MRTICGSVVLWFGAALLLAGFVLLGEWLVADVMHWAEPRWLTAAVAFVAFPMTLVPEYWQRLWGMIAEILPIRAFLLLAGSALVIAGVALLNVRFPRRPPRALREAMKAAGRRAYIQRTTLRGESRLPPQEPVPAPIGLPVAAPTQSKRPRRTVTVRLSELRIVHSRPADEAVPAPAWGPALAWRQRYLDEIGDFAAHRAAVAVEAQRHDGMMV